jgi:putative Ca2+/H+ antiporter (TMEM165/GDT1 family)
VGSTLALWTVSALAVTLGNKLGSRIPKRPLRRAAGALFIVFAIASAFVGF